MARRLALVERHVPYVVVAVFLGLLAVGLRDVLTSVYLNGDAASGPVLAELLGERDGRAVVLGEYFWLEALYLLRAIAWLPGHRQLGQVLPLVLYAVSVFDYDIATRIGPAPDVP